MAKISNKTDETHIILKILGVKIKIRTLKSRSENAQRKRKRINDYKLAMSLAREKYPEYLARYYFEQTGETLDLDNPRTYNQKIQWLKLFDATPEKTRLSDKYLVREHVKNKIGEECLIPLLGVWDRFEDIDFNALPEKFVLKCNHGCQYNIIVTDKSAFDKRKARKRIKQWMGENFAFKNGLELQYTDIAPKIIAEEYLENNNNALHDYKVYCFGGKARFIQYLSERLSSPKLAFYDANWQKQGFTVDGYSSTDVERPQNLEKLVELAEILAKGFCHARVDFYVLNNGAIKFGEFTFTPGSGYLAWRPKEQDLLIGQMLELPGGKGR